MSDIYFAVVYQIKTKYLVGMSNTEQGVRFYPL